MATKKKTAARKAAPKPEGCAECAPLNADPGASITETHPHVCPKCQRRFTAWNVLPAKSGRAAKKATR